MFQRVNKEEKVSGPILFIEEITEFLQMKLSQIEVENDRTFKTFKFSKIL